MRGALPSEERRSNRSTREEFLGCTDYPNCDHTEPFHGAAQALAERVAELEQQVSEKPGDHRPVWSDDGLRESLGERVKSLIFQFHPERRGEHVSANEVVAALNQLRGGVGT